MVVLPKIKGFICTTAHPLGCAQNVLDQIKLVQSGGPIKGKSGKALIIGSSNGFGLSTRITLAFGLNCPTMGVFYEKPPSPGRTATAGYYNTVALEAELNKAGLFAQSFNLDAFTSNAKERVISEIKEKWGQVDYLIYSLAAPRRTDPIDGQTYKSALKTQGESLTSKTINSQTGEIYQITIPAAEPEDILGTIKVMGGEDWKLWVEALQAANCLAPEFVTMAYSYVGPELTQQIYRKGCIGEAKKHLEATTRELNQILAPYKGKAYISVNKALVTLSSAAIPVMSLYITLLYKAMRDLKLHEGCIEQIIRLFRTKFFGATGPELDGEGLIRMDDWELQPEVQKVVEKLFADVTTENVNSIASVADFNNEFLRLFGFGIKGVDYDADVNIEPENSFIS